MKLHARAVLLVTEKAALVLSRLLAATLAFSAVAKIVAPDQVIETSGLLLDDLGLKLPFSVISILAFVLIAWELIVAFLFIINPKKMVMLSALLGTISVFIFVSLYLERQGKLSSCGCMGGASQAFKGLHFPYLFGSFAVLSILLYMSISEGKAKSGDPSGIQ